MKTGNFLAGVALGVFVGLGVGFFVGSHATKTIRTKLSKQTHPSGPTMQIVCSRRDLPSGHVISRADLARKEVFESAIPTDRCISPEEAPLILGRKLLFSVDLGEPVLWPDIEGGQPEAAETKENQQKSGP